MVCQNCWTTYLFILCAVYLPVYIQTYHGTCMCAIKKYTNILTHLHKRCMWPLQAALLLTAGSFVCSLPSCLGEWGGRGLWLESAVRWGVTKTRGSGQNIDRYMINVSEPHIRTIMYKSYFCSVWGVGFFYCRKKMFCVFVAQSRFDIGLV